MPATLEELNVQRAVFNVPQHYLPRRFWVLSAMAHIGIDSQFGAEELSTSVEQYHPQPGTNETNITRKIVMGAVNAGMAREVRRDDDLYRLADSPAWDVVRTAGAVLLDRPQPPSTTGKDDTRPPREEAMDLVFGTKQHLLILAAIFGTKEDFTVSDMIKQVTNKDRNGIRLVGSRLMALEMAGMVESLEWMPHRLTSYRTKTNNSAWQIVEKAMEVFGIRRPENS